MNTDGSEPHKVEPPEGLHCRNGDWSPDGERIVAYCWGGDVSGLFILRLDGSDPVTIGGETVYASFPRWSPNGKRLVYLYMRNGYGNPGIYTVKLDGSDRRKVFFDHYFAGPASWKRLP